MPYGEAPGLLWHPRQIRQGPLLCKGIRTYSEMAAFSGSEECVTTRICCLPSRFRHNDAFQYRKNGKTSENASPGQCGQMPHLPLLSYCSQTGYVPCRDESFCHLYCDKICGNPLDCLKYHLAYLAFSKQESCLLCPEKIHRQASLPLPLPLKNRKWQAHSYHSRSLQFPD